MFLEFLTCLFGCRMQLRTIVYATRKRAYSMETTYTDQIRDFQNFRAKQKRSDLQDSAVAFSDDYSRAL